VLQIATLGSPTVMKRTDRLVLFVRRYLADLVLVDGGPVADIANIRHTDLVIEGRRDLRSGAIYRSLACCRGGRRRRGTADWWRSRRGGAG